MKIQLVYFLYFCILLLFVDFSTTAAVFLCTTVELI